MPVPTDQLADEIKELNHRLEKRLDSQERAFQDLGRRLDLRLDSQEKAFREMRDEFNKFREVFMVFRMRVNTILAIASTVILLSAGAVAVGVLTYQYERGRMEAVIANQSASMDRLEKRFDELRPLGDRLDRLSEDIARLQGKLDHVGAPVTKP